VKGFKTPLSPPPPQKKEKRQNPPKAKPPEKKLVKIKACPDANQSHELFLWFFKAKS